MFREASNTRIELTILSIARAILKRTGVRLFQNAGFGHRVIILTTLKSKVSIMASVAHIPWMGRYFIGHLVTLYLDGTFYKFTTYNGSKYKAALTEEKVMLSFKRKNLILNIEAIKGHTGALISPIQGDMSGKVNESLAATLHVSLIQDGKEIYKGTGRHSGLEVGGEADVLLTSRMDMSVYIPNIVQGLRDWYAEELKFRPNSDLSLQSFCLSMAERLFEAYTTSNPVVCNQINNYHPSFIGMKWPQLQTVPFSMSDALDTVAFEHGFKGYESLPEKELDIQFERAVGAIVDGHLDELRKFAEDLSQIINSHFSLGTSGKTDSLSG